MERRTVATILWLVVLAGACAGDETGSASSSVTSDPPPTATSTTAAEPSSTTTTTSRTTTTPPTTTSAPVLSVPGPTPGSAWAVVGVPAGEVLNVRSGPGQKYGAIETLDPQAERIVVTGDAAVVATSLWWALDPAIGGWVNAWYLAGAGLTEDRTSAVVERHGSIPMASSMEELTLIVLATFEDARTNVTIATGEEGVIAEHVVDVFPSEGDDSVRGYRLLIFGQRDGDSDPFSLYAVELRHLCWRGVDPGGLCV